MTYAIYFEVESKDGVAVQSIFVPEISEYGLGSPPILWWRILRSQYRIESWSGVRNDNYYPSAKGSELEIMANSTDQLAGISSYMKTIIGDPDLTLVGSFPILLTDAVKKETTKNSTSPSPRLLSMISTARTVLGWPSTVRPYGSVS